MTRYTYSSPLTVNSTDPDGDPLIVSHISFGVGSTPALIDWVATPVLSQPNWAGHLEFTKSGPPIYDDEGNSASHPGSGSLTPLVVRFRVMDSAGAVSSNIAQATLNANVVAGGDVTAPTVSIVGYDPAGDIISLTWGEAIQAGSGTITLRNVTDATTVETFAVPGAVVTTLAPGKVTILGSVLKFQPSVALLAGKTYSIRFTAGTIKDLSNNNCVAVSDDSLSFATAAAGGGADWRGYQAGYDGGTTADIYVSPTGSDANPGTFASPKLTIDAAVIANPGKVIALRGGKYRQKATLSGAASGTSGTPTIVKNYGTEVPIITGGEVLTGLVPCVAGDAAVVGARWPNIYKVTLNDSVLGSTNVMGFTPIEAGRMMPLAAEHILSPKTPAEPYNVEDWPTWEVIKSGSTITGYRNTAITGKYTQAQIQAMKVVFYGSPNLAYTSDVASFDTVNNIINLVNNGQTYGVGLYQNRMCLKNTISEIKQGQWAFKPNGDGTTTYYLWPMNPANVSGNIEYAARMTCLDLNGASHVHVKGVVFEHTGGSAGGQKDWTQPVVSKTPNQNIRFYNCHVRKHWRIGEREVFGLLAQEVTDFQMHNCNVSECWGMYGVHPVGKVSGVGNPTTLAQKTKGMWINACIFEDISSSAIRIYQQAFGAVTNSLARRNVGVSPHANVHDPKQQSHYILAHGCDWSASMGYITYQQASAVHITYCYNHGNAKGDDKRAIWDQCGNNDGPAFQFSVSGDSYWLNNHWAPDVQDLASWNAIKGGISATCKIFADNNIMFNSLDTFINGNVTRGNKNVVVQGTAVAGELTEARTTTYEDVTGGDFRIKAGSLIRSTAGNSKTTEKAALLSNLPQLTSTALDKDINGATINWSAPPIGPVVGGVLNSAAEHFIEMPALSSGTLAVGNTLTMGIGRRAPADIACSFQWIVSTDSGYSWSDVGGAISQSFVVPAGSGKRYGCKVKLRNNEVTVYIPGAVP